MHTLYIQTFSRESENPESPDRPAWTNPFLASIAGIYCNADGMTTAFVTTLETIPSPTPLVPEATLFTFRNEQDLLANFWLKYNGEPSNIFYTFAGRTFTVPFLYLRSAKYNVTPTYGHMMKERYKIGVNHCDIADFCSFNGAIAKPSLKQMASFLGLPMPTVQEDQLQVLLAQLQATPNPAFLRTIVQSGVEYCHLIYEIAKWWLARMKPVTI